jgi:hypothetical protein
VGNALRRLKLKPAVFLPTLRAKGILHITSNDVEVVAADTAKRRPAPFTLKTGVVTMVIIQPEAEKEHGNQQAVDDGSDLQAHEMDFRKGGVAQASPKGNRDNDPATSKA